MRQQPVSNYLPPRACCPQDQIKLTAQLAGPLKQLQSAAERIAEVSKECKLEVDTGGAQLQLFSFLFLFLIFGIFSFYLAMASAAAGQGMQVGGGTGEARSQPVLGMVPQLQPVWPWRLLPPANWLMF